MTAFSFLTVPSFHSLLMRLSLLERSRARSLPHVLFALGPKFLSKYKQLATIVRMLPQTLSSWRSRSAPRTNSTPPRPSNTMMFNHQSHTGACGTEGGRQSSTRNTIQPFEVLDVTRESSTPTFQRHPHSSIFTGNRFNNNDPTSPQNISDTDSSATLTPSHSTAASSSTLSSRPLKTSSNTLKRRCLDDIELMDQQSKHFTLSASAHASVEDSPQFKKLKPPRSFVGASSSFKTSPLTSAPAMKNKRKLSPAKTSSTLRPRTIFDQQSRPPQNTSSGRTVSSSTQTSPVSCTAPLSYPQGTTFNPTAMTDVMYPQLHYPPPTSAERLFVAEVNEITSILNNHIDQTVTLCTELHEKNVRLERRVHVLEAAQSGVQGQRRCGKRVEEFVNASNHRIDKNHKYHREKFKRTLQGFDDMHAWKTLKRRVPGGAYGGPKLKAPEPRLFARVMAGQRRH